MSQHQGQPVTRASMTVQSDLPIAHHLGLSHERQHTVTNLGTTINRRSLVKSLAGIGVTAAVLTPTLGLMSPTAARSTDSLIVNTDGARLRSGPGTGYSILASLAKGTEVRFLADGGSANGYRWYKVRVLATGKEGYVAANLLSAPDGGSDPVIVGTAVTTATVNLRSGPSTSHQILRVVPQGATVKISNTVQNGFRYVTHNGLAGWIADQYLRAGGSSTPTITGVGWTISSVNLRSGPGTSHAILRVVPVNAKLGTSTTVKNGFRYVSYSGQTGWMADAYISFTNGSGDGGSGPVPNYHTTTANLNLRAEPSTSAKVLLVIPAGARVTPHGLTTNGFAKVTYNGTVGWAATAYLN